MWLYNDLNVDYLIGMYLDHAKQISKDIEVCYEFPSVTLPNIIYVICKEDKIVFLQYNHMIYTKFPYNDKIKTSDKINWDWKFIIGEERYSASKYLYKYHPDIEFTFISKNYLRCDFFEEAVYLEHDNYNITKIIKSNI